MGLLVFFSPTPASSYLYSYLLLLSALRPNATLKDLNSHLKLFFKRRTGKTIQAGKDARREGCGTDSRTFPQLFAFISALRQ